MIPVHIFQDHVDMLTLNIGKPSFSDSTIEVLVRNLRVWKGFSGLEQDVNYRSCVLNVLDKISSDTGDLTDDFFNRDVGIA